MDRGAVVGNAGKMFRSLATGNFWVCNHARITKENVGFRKVEYWEKSNMQMGEGWRKFDGTKKLRSKTALKPKGNWNGGRRWWNLTLIKTNKNRSGGTTENGRSRQISVHVSSGIGDRELQRKTTVAILQTIICQIDIPPGDEKRGEKNNGLI